MLVLAQMNENGRGMHADMSSAIEYYQRAADLGEPVSQLKLARLIVQGQDLKRGDPTAMSASNAGNRSGINQSPNFEDSTRVKE